MKIFEGKSIFIWNVPDIFDGDAVLIAKWLKAHGFVSVMVKAADGPYVFYPSHIAFPNWVSSMFKMGRPNVDRDFVETLQLAGLAVIGWGFNYGRDPEGEGTVAAKQCNALGLDGWIMDIEGEFENRSTAITDAGKFIGKFREFIQRPVPLAYCGWAEFFSPTGTQWHNIALARFFMGLPEVTHGVPMIYWDSYDFNGKPIPTPPAKVELLLMNVLKQWGFTEKPITPAGRAYTGDGGIATPESVLAFGTLAHSLCNGVTWWVLDRAFRMPLVADALQQTPGWDGIITPPIEPPPPIGDTMLITGTIVVEKVNVREQMSASSADVGDLFNGETITTDKPIKNMNGYDWFEIKTPLRFAGKFAACGPSWAPHQYIRTVITVDPPTDPDPVTVFATYKMTVYSDKTAKLELLP